MERRPSEITEQNPGLNKLMTLLFNCFEISSDHKCMIQTMSKDKKNGRMARTKPCFEQMKLEDPRFCIVSILGATAPG